MKADALPKTGAKWDWQQRFADYFALTKPTITLLVAVTVIPSLLLASPHLPHPLQALAAIIGASLASASAAVFNQLVESDLDVQMQRTRRRSLASGRVSRDSALAFGLGLGALGLSLLYFCASPVAALAALAGHLFYVFVYTLYLKPRTVQNIVIGGAAGAVGPLIGWAAVTGELTWPAWVLFLIIFLWTPPHFWALALKYKEDYARAGVPMYPVVHGEKKTKQWMFFYTLTLVPCVLSLYIFGVAGLLFLGVGGALTLKFCWDALQLLADTHNEKVMPFFHYSCLYVFGLFGALTLDRFLSLL